MIFIDRQHYRRGLSLIEVLMSIMVVTIGLLGIASLIPLAQNDVKQGTVNDQKFLVAKRAYRESRVRGLIQPQNCLYLGINGTMYTELFNVEHGNWFTENRNEIVHRNDLNAYDNFPSFVIDPWFAAVHDTTADSQKKYFPYSLTPDTNNQLHVASRPRVTIKADPFGGVNGSTPGRAGNGTPASLVMAYQLFMAQDDIVFEIPEDADESPTQLYTANGSKRQFSGRYSWLITVVSEGIGLYGQQGYFRVAVVVFRDRVIPTNLAVTPTQDERVVNVTFLGGGFAGGDVLLSAGDEDTLKRIDDGEWMMLIPSSGQVHKPFVPNGINRWYQVDHVSGDPRRDGSNWLLEATLSGPDVDVQGLGGGARAVVMENTVAVYEKTMPLELTSNWAVD